MNCTHTQKKKFSNVAHNYFKRELEKAPIRQPQQQCGWWTIINKLIHRSSRLNEFYKQKKKKIAVVAFFFFWSTDHYVKKKYKIMIATTIFLFRLSCSIVLYVSHVGNASHEINISYIKKKNNKNRWNCCLSILMKFYWICIFFLLFLCR